MLNTEALQIIVDNAANPALNYAVNYAKEALRMSRDTKTIHSVEEFRVQLLYVSSNLSGWRANKKFPITKETIKLVRETLKQKVVQNE
jgi:hypothetical protein